MTWGIDQVQDVVRAIGSVERQPHRLRLDGDAALALDVHAVEVLGPHLARVNDTGDLQHPIGQGRLAVIDMRDDAEIPDQLGAGVSGRWLGHCVLVWLGPRNSSRKVIVPYRALKRGITSVVIEFPNTLRRNDPDCG